MKFGLNFFPSFRPSDLSTAAYFDQVLRMCERADQLGYRSAKAVEHYFHDYGGQTPNPIVLLSAIAARTRRLRLITGAVIPAFNHPVKLAGELAMLDNVSGGRLDVGFGRAFIPKEFEVFGISMDESRARFEEGIDIITRLWTEDRVTYQGKFHRFNDVHSTPRPVQKPHPPIWVGGMPGVISAPAVRRVALLCDAWHPLGLSLDDVEKGIATIRQMAAKAGRRDELKFAPRNLLNLTPDAKGRGRAAFEGSPDEVVADIRRARGLGVDYLTFDMPKLDVPGMVRTIERFVKDVKPAAA